MGEAWKLFSVRAATLTIALGVALALALAAPTAAAPRTPRSELALLAGINALRSRHGLPRLRLSPALTRAAASHDRQMRHDGYFGHDSPGGSPFWRRILAWYPTLPGRQWIVGENIVWNSLRLSATRTIGLWMGSADHRANLLDARWREVGIALLRVDSAPGVYDNGPATIITADFGMRG